MFQHQPFQLLGLKFNKYEYFDPLEVENRVSEIQFDVGVNLNTTT